MEKREVLTRIPGWPGPEPRTIYSIIHSRILLLPYASARSPFFIQSVYLYNEYEFYSFFFSPIWIQRVLKRLCVPSITYFISARPLNKRNRKKRKLPYRLQATHTALFSHRTHEAFTYDINEFRWKYEKNHAAWLYVFKSVHGVKVCSRARQWLKMFI